MPECPLNGKVIESCCKNTSCFNNVPTLDFNCLSIHCSIYGKTAMEVLNHLYGKSFRLMVSLVIKVIRVAFVIKELEPKPNRKIQGFEKKWIDSINKAGNINPNFTWLQLVKENDRYVCETDILLKEKLFLERIAQALNTMEATQYPLKDIVSAYRRYFGEIDCRALAISSEDLHYLKELEED